ncbi:discoidin domain-containing protein [Kribbella sp. CA-293567]|uniref:discoidin domain-containing protein n=1 Tax=Kribbella sp. CA-293567 TaxID=3002436 RepID=UPI0022DE0EF7|nr:discoidin domain-containing protein [Kribbella sp. CA-293567]WBQ06501.1 discoidin domain-containing protein [Kribbella sp. CA-293567]
MRVRPGELVCGDCGEGNAATRKFCRRCGESLAEAQLVKTPWWRRLRLRRKPKTLAAGSRPKGPGDSGGRIFHAVLRKVRAGVSVLVLVFGLLAGFYPPVRTMVVQQVGNLKQKVRGVAETALAPVRPIAVDGPKSATGHPPKAAFDTFKNTSWIATWSAQNSPTLTVRLDHPVALRKVIVSNGDAKNFAGTMRPAVLEFRYSNEKSDLVRLTDTPGPQQLSLRNGVGVSSFTVKVINVYPVQGAKTLALSEIELFGIG